MPKLSFGNNQQPENHCDIPEKCLSFYSVFLLNWVFVRQVTQQSGFIATASLNMNVDYLET
jgi:hypothetical protein